MRGDHEPRTRTETGRLVVERPSAWVTPFPIEAPWTSGYRPAPDSVEQIQLSGDFGEFVTASEAVGTLIGKAQVPRPARTLARSTAASVRSRVS